MSQTVDAGCAIIAMTREVAEDSSSLNLFTLEEGARGRPAANHPISDVAAEEGLHDVTEQSILAELGLLSNVGETVTQRVDPDTPASHSSHQLRDGVGASPDTWSEGGSERLGSTVRRAIAAAIPSVETLAGVMGFPQSANRQVPGMGASAASLPPLPLFPSAAQPPPPLQPQPLPPSSSMSIWELPYVSPQIQA